MFPLISSALGAASVLLAVWVWFVVKSPLPFCLLTALMVGNVLLAWWKPRAALVAFLFCLPLANSILIAPYLGYFSLAAILFLSFLLGWLVHRIAHRDLEPLETPLKCPLLGFVAIGFGSGIITILRYADFYPFKGRGYLAYVVNRMGETSSEAIERVFGSTVVFLMGPAVFWAVLRLVTSRRDVARLLAALALGIACAGSFGLYQSLGHTALGNLPHYVPLNRINATFTDPNAMGIFLALALPPIAATFLAAPRWRVRATALLLAVGILHLLMLSGSRTALLSLGIAVLLGLTFFLVPTLRFSRRDSARSLQPLLVCLVLAVAFAPIHRVPPDSRPTVLGERLEYTIEMIRERGIAGLLQSDRLPLWQRGTLVCSQFPLSGIGLGAFWMEIPNFLRWNPHEVYFRDNANCYYLQIMAEMGAGALLLAIMILAMILWRALRIALAPSDDPLERVFRAALCGCMAAFVLSFLTGPHTLFPEVQCLFWAMTAIVFAKFHDPGTRPVRPVGPVGPVRPVRLLLLAAEILLVLAVLGGQTRNALSVLSLRRQQERYGMEKGAGFYAWQGSPGSPRARWTRKEAWAVIPWSGSQVRFNVYVGHPDAAGKPVRLEVLMNGKVARVEVFEKTGETRSLSLPVPASPSPTIEIGLRVSRTWKPAKCLPGNLDTRDLGVLVSEFE